MNEVTEAHIHYWNIDSYHVGKCKCGEIRYFDPLGEKDPILLRPSNSEWKTLPNRDRAGWVNFNRKRILFDVAALGEKEARIKWSIPFSSWIALKEGRWSDSFRTGEDGRKELKPLGELNIEPPTREQLINNSSKAPKAAKQTPKKAREKPSGGEVLTPEPPQERLPSGDRLPSFPEFDDSWAPEVQIQWLEVYSRLAAQLAKSS